MAYVHHVHVLERGHVPTLCCTNSRAFLVTYFFLFSFLDRSVLFSPINMHVRLVISSQKMNTTEYCALVKNTASWLVQPLAGAVGSKWGVSHQSTYMGWTFSHPRIVVARQLIAVGHVRRGRLHVVRGDPRGSGGAHPEPVPRRPRRAADPQHLRRCWSAAVWSA